MPDDPIPSNDSAHIRNYWKGVEKPRWRPWLGKIKGSDIGGKVYGVPVSLGPLDGVFRGVTHGSRLRYLTYNWLDPIPEQHPLRDFETLTRNAGLDRIPDPELVPQVMNGCEQFARDHRGLAMWARRRAALLESRVVQGVTLSPELRRVLPLHRRQLQIVSAMALGRPDDAISEAISLARQAMHGAAQAVERVLSPHVRGGIGLTASFMLPVGSLAHAARFIESDQGRRERSAIAEALWKALPGTPSRYLIVVDGTEPRHVGFWVPVVEGPGGVNLPGAPQAFADGSGSAVFKNDLPTLDAFTSTATGEWQQYVRRYVQGRLFVSLALALPDPEKANSLVPVAVLNVNASHAEDEHWYRAYHREWLERAQQEAEPFMEVAFEAEKLRLSVSEAASIDTGSRLWNMTAFSRVAKLLLTEPGGDDGNER